MGAPSLVRVSMTSEATSVVDAEVDDDGVAVAVDEDVCLEADSGWSIPS